MNAAIVDAMIRAVAIVLLLAACSKRSSEPTVGSGSGSGSAAVIVGAPADAAGTVGRGQACTNDGECAAGLACVSYSTIGGEPRATCEIRCGPKPDYACPDGLGCQVIAHGPSETCQKPQ